VHKPSIKEKGGNKKCRIKISRFKSKGNKNGIKIAGDIVQGYSKISQWLGLS
jgi:hypothetical protein